MVTLCFPLSTPRNASVRHAESLEPGRRLLLRSCPATAHSSASGLVLPCPALPQVLLFVKEVELLKKLRHRWVPLPQAHAAPRPAPGRLWCLEAALQG